ncbi:MAG: tandem-95 repeat protein [Desulfobacteraceae bacterium]|nr:tandem-95 repeat protein [Desulfobacteraceae bacterium]
MDNQINAFAYHNSRVYAGGIFTAPTSSIGMYSINLPPKATADSYSVNEEATLSDNVLTNDSDPESTALTAVLVTAPPAAATESFNLNSDGSFTYTPKLNFSGSVSFTYKAADSPPSPIPQKYSDITTVTITVNAVNDAPVANSDSYLASEDTLLTVSAAQGVLANDTDVDSSTLTAVLDSGPSHSASFTLNANGSFTYKASANYVGTDSSHIMPKIITRLPMVSASYPQP